MAKKSEYGSEKEGGKIEEYEQESERNKRGSESRPVPERQKTEREKTHCVRGHVCTHTVEIKCCSKCAGRMAE